MSDWRYYVWRAGRPFTRLSCRLTRHRPELYTDPDGEWEICSRCDHYQNAH